MALQRLAAVGERLQTLFGFGDQFPQSGFGAQVLGKTKDGPQPQDMMAEPDFLVLDLQNAPHRFTKQP